MLLFVLWAVLVIGALAGAAYSHYRYRVRNNQYYERLFAKNREEPVGAEIECNTDCSYTVPVLALVIVSLLVPVFLIG